MAVTHKSKDYTERQANNLCGPGPLCVTAGTPARNVPLPAGESGMARKLSQEHIARMQEAQSASKNHAKLMQDRLPDLDPSRRPSVEKRLAEMPESCRINYLTAVSGKSITAGVKAFCLECVGWDRDEVRLCTAPACPLFPYRPFKKAVEI